MWGDVGRHVVANFPDASGCSGGGREYDEARGTCALQSEGSDVRAGVDATSQVVPVHFDGRGVEPAATANPRVPSLGELHCGVCPSMASVRVCACVGQTLLSYARGFPRETEEVTVGTAADGRTRLKECPRSGGS